jgi:hypothetical protein
VASGTGCRLRIFSRRRLDAMSVRTAVVADLRASANEVEVSWILYSEQAGFCDVEPLLFLESTYYADCDGGGGNSISALECTDRLPRRYSSGTFHPLASSGVEDRKKRRSPAAHNKSHATSPRTYQHTNLSNFANPAASLKATRTHRGVVC